MTTTDFIDALQTSVLIVIAAAQIYTLVLLRNEIRGAGLALKRVIDELADTRVRLDRIEGRLDKPC